jgi:cell division protease FtsH
LGNIAFPLTFILGLFLVNRIRNGGDDAGGAGGPGGMQNPMNMGKSKARVDM